MESKKRNETAAARAAGAWRLLPFCMRAEAAFTLYSIFFHDGCINCIIIRPIKSVRIVVPSIIERTYNL